MQRLLLALLALSTLALHNLHGQEAVHHHHTRVRRAQLVATSTPTPKDSPTPSATVETSPTPVWATPTPENTPATTHYESHPSGSGALIGLVFTGLLVGGGIWGIAKITGRFSPGTSSPAALPDDTRQLLENIKEDIGNSIIPRRVGVPGFVCKAGEAITMAVTAVKYYHDQSHVRYEGGSRGVSFRVCRGVSYRLGAHKSHRVTNSTLDHLDTGTLVITNQAVSLIGDNAVYMPYKKIVNFEWYTDGFGFQTAAARNTHYVFANIREDVMPYIRRAITCFTTSPETFGDTRKNQTTFQDPKQLTDEYNGFINKYLDLMEQGLKQAAPGAEVLDRKYEPGEINVKGETYRVCQMKVKVPQYDDPHWLYVTLINNDTEIKAVSANVYQHFLQTGEFQTDQSNEQATTNSNGTVVNR